MVETLTLSAPARRASYGAVPGASQTPACHSPVPERAHNAPGTPLASPVWDTNEEPGVCLASQDQTVWEVLLETCAVLNTEPTKLQWTGSDDSPIVLVGETEGQGAATTLVLSK